MLFKEETESQIDYNIYYHIEHFYIPVFFHKKFLEAHSKMKIREKGDKTVGQKGIRGEQDAFS